MSWAVSVKYTQDLKDLVGKEYKNMSLRLFISITCCKNNTLVMMGEIQYTIKIDFTCFFLFFIVATRKFIIIWLRLLLLDRDSLDHSGYGSLQARIYTLRGSCLHSGCPLHRKASMT